MANLLNIYYIIYLTSFYGASCNSYLQVSVFPIFATLLEFGNISRLERPRLLFTIYTKCCRPTLSHPWWLIRPYVPTRNLRSAKKNLLRKPMVGLLCCCPELWNKGYQMENVRMNYLLYMDDLKLYARSKKEIESLVNTVRIFSILCSLV